MMQGPRIWPSQDQPLCDSRPSDIPLLRRWRYERRVWGGTRDCWDERLARRPAPSPGAELAEPPCQRRWAQSRQTALFANPSLGLATVTRPFHPLYGQTLEVLKVRRLAGRESLSLRHPERGSLAICRDWTDWAPPGASPPPGSPPLRVDAFGLIRLAELLACLHQRNERG